MSTPVGNTIIIIIQIMIKKKKKKPVTKFTTKPLNRIY